MQLTRPILLADRSRAERNITRMLAKAKASRVVFRPHFKTHQAAEVGSWFRALGVTAITVSSLDMACYFSRHGWSDITMAMTVNPAQIKAIKELAAEINLGILCDSPEALELIARKISNPLRLWLKIDTGYRRSGIPAADRIALARMAEILLDSPWIDTAGILSHNGLAYRCSGPRAVQALYLSTIAALNQARDFLQDRLKKKIMISIGDTPTCNLIDNFTAVDEIRPGNFVFNDLMQLAIGSCTENDLALAVACPVIGKYPRRGEIVLHGGAVHLSKEFLSGSGNKPVFGRVTTLDEQGWGGLAGSGDITSLSQEHAVVAVDPAFMETARHGRALAVIPVHSCLAVAGVRYYLCPGNGEFAAMTEPYDPTGNA